MPASVTRGLRAAAGRPTSFNPKARTFEACLASERLCRSYRWSKRGWDAIEVDERLPMSGIVDLEKMRGAPLLNSHSSWSLRDVIGVIEDAWIDADKLMIRARLSERAEVDPIAKDIETGVLTSLSVGFQILEDGEVVERAGDVPLVVVKRWKPLEGSVVPVPADDTAKIRAARRTNSKRTGASLMDAELFKRSLVEAITTAITTAVDAAASDEGGSDNIDAEAEAAAEEARAAVMAKRGAGRTTQTPAVASERSAEEKAAIVGLRTASKRHGLEPEFDALEKAGATVAELRGVLTAGLRTNPTEIDAVQKPTQGARSLKDLKFENTTAGKRAAGK